MASKPTTSLSSPRRNHTSLLEGQKLALELMVQGDPLAKVLDVLVKTAEENSAVGMLASILIADEDVKHLRHGAAPSLPDAYNLAIDGIEVGPKVGSCGAAAHSGKPVIATDIETHPNWIPFRELAAKHGLAACWSTPILSGKGKVLGTFAMYYRESRRPTPGDREIVDVITRTAALAIERERNRSQRKRSEALQSGQTRVFEMLASGTPLSEVLSCLVRIIEEQTDGLLGSVLVRHPDGTRFNLGVGPSLPQPYIEALQSASIVPPYLGPCGRAAHLGEEVVVSDITADLRWAEGWRELASGSGLHTCYSSPIVASDGTILGSFGLYFKKARDPKSISSQLIQTATHLAGIAIERRRAEAALRESEQRYTGIVKQAFVGVAETDLSGRFVSVNERYCKIVGRSAEELLTLRMQDITHPEDVGKNLTLVQKTVEEGVPFEIEKRYVRPDGSHVWVHNSVFAVRTASGGPRNLVAISEDITERRRAEDALRDSEEKFRMIADNMLQLAWTCDQLGNVTWYNQRWLDYTGLTFEEMKDWGWKRVHHPDHVDRVVASVQRSRESGEVWEDTFPLRSKEGEYRWFLSRAVPIRNAEGKIVRWFGTNTDVTDQRSIEEALRDSEEKFRMLADNMLQLAWTCDQLGNVTWYNQRWLDYTGLTFEEMKDWGWKKVHHPDHVDRVVASVQRSRESGDVWEDTFPLRSKHGEYRWFLSRAVPIRDAESKIVRWFGTNTDITDQMRAEDALRKADKLAATGQLAAAVAHEINNPMQALTNLLALLTYKTALDKDALAIANMAQAEVARMAHITKQMLAFHRDSVTPVPVRMTEVLDDVLELLAVKLKGDFRVDRNYEFTGSIEAFPGEIRQAFLNLLNNAADATSSDDPVRVHMFPSRDWRQPERRGVRVVIADSGSGVAAEHRKRIFEPFFTTKQEKGTGLGLWVVKEIVQRHGGRIGMRSCASLRRSGTVFSVFLPLKVPKHLLRLPV